FPAADPHYNAAGDMANWQTMCWSFIKATRACGETGTNSSKVQEYRQRPDEHPSDFRARLRQTLLKHRGMMEQNFNDALTASIFVDQATSDICNYFKDHMLGWQGEKLQKIRALQYSFFDGRGEKKKHKLEKVGRKERQQEASLLA
ncbi:UNVERIFIED_CONTAM: hypothetical protein FQV15_0002380, partial [Eudyptes pachyrhynchus]